MVQRCSHTLDVRELAFLGHSVACKTDTSGNMSIGTHLRQAAAVHRKSSLVAPRRRPDRTNAPADAPLGRIRPVSGLGFPSRHPSPTMEQHYGAADQNFRQLNLNSIEIKLFSKTMSTNTPLREVPVPNQVQVPDFAAGGLVAPRRHRVGRSDRAVHGAWLISDWCSKEDDLSFFAPVLIHSFGQGPPSPIYYICENTSLVGRSRVLPFGLQGPSGIGGRVVVTRKSPTFQKRTGRPQTREIP